MDQDVRRRGVVTRVTTEVVGWAIVVLGIILWPLPGPGLLIIVAGITVLSRQHAWARRVLEPVREKAVQAARFGVATWPRIALSALGGVWLLAVGVVWWVSPQIPEFTVLGIGFGPRLPAAGWATGLGIIASAFVAWGLLIYSVVRWRER
jgi:uncharacterized protein (TIGR02611 family)